VNSINRSDIDIYPYKSVITLHESGIPTEIIALQLDLDIKEVTNTIKNLQIVNKEKEDAVLQASEVSKLGMLLIDPVFDIESAILEAQKRMWYQLKVKSEFNISQENTQKLLASFTGANVTLVILHVDLVGSTDLSMNLPLNRLLPIIQAFTQEMSLIIEAYGGYVFKYVGDAILAFFFTEKDELYLPSSNAVSCGYSMVKVVHEGMNSILEQNGYPELGIRIGIDVGDNIIGQYDLRPETITTTTIIHPEKNGEDSTKVDEISPYPDINKKNHSTTVLSKHQLDIIGYTINITTKMTNYAKPNQIIIGEEVYGNLDIQTQKKFKKLNIKSIMWNYINNSTGNIYELYVNVRI